MKKILGLDLGTNSIGWALLDKNKEKILGIGSRIVPMGDDKGNFEAGKKITRNAIRRIARGIRKGNHRYKLRRNKLLYGLHEMNMLPDLISFGYFKTNENGVDEKIIGQFPVPEKLQKVFVLPIQKGNKNYKGDTTVFILELRKKALTESVSLKELGRVFYLLNQKRGYSGGGEEDEKEVTNREGEIEKVKKIYKSVKALKINPVQHKEEFGKGRAKKEFPVYKLKVVNVETSEIFEGTAVKNIAVDVEIDVTRLKSSKESKQTRFQFADDDVKWPIEGSDIVNEIPWKNSGM